MKPIWTLKAVILTGLILGNPVSAAIVAVPVFQKNGDFEFNDACKQGKANETGNQACEFAVGELRGGNNARSGDWEVGVQNPPGKPVDVKHVTWGNGVAEAFTFSYVSASETLSLAIKDVTSTATDVNLEDMLSMFIRTRSKVVPGKTVTLSNMLLNGFRIPDLGASGAGSSGAGYLQVSGINWSADWKLTGAVTFAWDSKSMPSGSKLNVNFKLTDIDALRSPISPMDTTAVPLPGTLWLLLAGLGAMLWGIRSRPLQARHDRRAVIR